MLTEEQVKGISEYMVSNNEACYKACAKFGTNPDKYKRWRDYYSLPEVVRAVVQYDIETGEEIDYYNNKEEALWDNYIGDDKVVRIGRQFRNWIFKVEMRYAKEE